MQILCAHHRKAKHQNKKKNKTNLTTASEKQENKNI